MHRQSACPPPFLPTVVEGKLALICGFDEILKRIQPGEMILFVSCRRVLVVRDVKMVNRLNAFICN
jgi:hypothetical protein